MTVSTPNTNPIMANLAFGLTVLFSLFSICFRSALLVLSVAAPSLPRFDVFLRGALSRTWRAHGGTPLQFRPIRKRHASTRQISCAFRISSEVNAPASI